MKVVGVGGSCEAKELLKSGELSATTIQDPWEDGRLAIEAAIKVAKGESVEQITYIQPATATKENETPSTATGNQLRTAFHPIRYCSDGRRRASVGGHHGTRFSSSNCILALERNISAATMPSGRR